MTALRASAILRLDFVIVGTARSGTTLVQRMACEMPGVAVPPETHFLSHFAPDLLARARFPLGSGELEQELSRYSALPVCAGLYLPIGAVVERLGGTCSSPFELFAAVVAELAGPCQVLGEKTPEHLLWWRPLADAWSDVRVVAVVRDPRAVVASNLEAPFGMAHVDVLAERWLADQRALTECRKKLGAGRSMVLRYEDVVTGPVEARSRLASALGIEAAATEPAGPDPGMTRPRLYQEWETWKHRVDGPITDDRLEHWRNVLTSSEAVLVEEICAPLMAEFGYGASTTLGERPTRRTREVHSPLRRARYRRGRRRIDRLIGRVQP